MDGSGLRGDRKALDEGPGMELEEGGWAEDGGCMPAGGRHRSGSRRWIQLPQGNRRLQERARSGAASVSTWVVLVQGRGG